MEKIQKLPDYVVRESVSSIVHIRKFLTLSIGIVVVVGLGVAVQNLPAGMQVMTHYVDSDEATAFSTVGGHIFVFRGMLEKLPHENALVMLLAHEIAHVKYRHPLKGLGKGVVASLMLSMMFGTAYSDTVDKVFHDAGLLTVLKFSQGQEILADDEGMRIYYQYYRHFNGMSDLYRVIEDNQPQLASGSFYPGVQSGISVRRQNIKRHYVKKMLDDQHAVTPFPPRIRAEFHLKSKQ